MIHRRLVGASVILICALLAGCDGWFKRDPGPQVIDARNIQRLHGKEWELRAITIDGTDVVMHVDGKMGLRFDPDGQVRGNGGVNQFSGGYRIGEDGALAWASPGFTVIKKAGPPEFQEKEKVFLDALRRTNRVIAGKVIMTLQTDNSEVVLTFLKPGSL